MTTDKVGVMALGDPDGTVVEQTVVVNYAPNIVVRISGAVGVGKTHVAETIRDALERKYGVSGCVIDIALTDIKHDAAVGNDLPPPPGTSFKIIEDITNKRG